MWTFTKRAFMSAVVYDPAKDVAKDSPFKKIAPGVRIKSVEQLEALPFKSVINLGRASYKRYETGWKVSDYAKTEYPSDDFIEDIAEGRVRRVGTHVLVRARVKEDLEDLKTVVPNVLIVEQPSADYRFRSVIPRAKWKKYLVQQVDEMDYDSHFKEVVRDNATQGPARHSAMMSVWSAMANLQPFGAYGMNDPNTGWYKGKYYGSADARGAAKGGGASSGKGVGRAETKPFTAPSVGGVKGVDTSRQGGQAGLWGTEYDPDDALGYALRQYDSDAVTERNDEDVERLQSGVIDVDTLRALILYRLGALELTPDEEARCDVPAWNVYERLVDDFGVGVRVFAPDIDDAIDAEEFERHEGLDEETENDEDGKAGDGI